MEQLNEGGLRVIGISGDESADAAAEFLDQHDIDYLNWRDPEGQFRIRFEGLIRLSAFPSTVVMRGSDVVAVKIGELGSADEVRRVLAASGA